MKHLLSLLLAFTALTTFTSCDNDDDDLYYVSVSGEGALTVDYNPPVNLFRMVSFSDADNVKIYLMGGNSFVNNEGDFGGRGASVIITYPNSDGDELLGEHNFAIDGAEYTAKYSTCVNYDAPSSSKDYTDLSAGTVIIRQSGRLYDLKILGSDVDNDNVIVSYRGYIYRAFSDIDDLVEPDGLNE